MWKFLPEADQQLLHDFEQHLRYEQNRSEHTVRAYLGDLHNFLIFACRESLFSSSLTELKEPAMRQWVSELGRTGTSPRSLRRKIQSLRALYHFAHLKGLVNSNPALRIPLPKCKQTLPEFVKEEEMEKILATEESVSADAETYEELRDRLILTLLYSTGIRRAELTDLNDSSLDLSRKELHVIGKRRKQRMVPLADELCQMFRDYLARRDIEFPQRQDEALIAHRGKRISYELIGKIVARQLQGTSTNRKTPHVLRHTFATSMLNNGADINTVKDFLGHSSLSTTQIYTHVSFAELRKNYVNAHPRARKNSEKDDK